MKKSIAMKWVKALKSEKYEQGFSNLKTGSNKFCCLGVLCEISSKSRWVENKNNNTLYYSTENMYLPKLVQNYAGIKTPNGLNLKLGKSLTSMNDSKEYTFKDIADYIEREYKNL